ncbi:MAG: hypothetical protein M1134_04285 [Actinobacteria bacterium]|nr:hypothetical protein [Actinomycetota bacterium]MCL5444724.1 hypothetical protein [Actinomycetota bacterium]
MAADSEVSGVDGGESGTVYQERADAHHLVHAHRLNRIISAILIVVVIGLVPWEVFLGMTLPSRFRANNWAFLWVGFDAILIAVLLYVAWAMWFRRQIMIAVAMVAGTLLMTDAYFDVVTSIGTKGEWVTLLTALGGEIPLGLVFYWVAWQVMKRSIAAFHLAMGGSGPPPKLRDAPLVFLQTNLAGRDSEPSKLHRTNGS